MLIWSFSVSSYAQDWSRYGYKSFKEKDYYGAAYYFNLAADLDTANLDLLWQFAESSRLSNNYKKAGESYKNLMNRDEKIAYPKAVFYLGDMLKRQEKYEEAGQYFSFYRDICIDKKDLLYKRSKIEIQACILALSWQNMSDLVEVTHPSFNLNSFDAEFSPFPLNDSLILFSSLRYDSLKTKKTNTDQYKAFIYQAQLANEKWSIEPLDSVINDTMVDNANPCITADSSQMYFTRCNDDGCAIYVSNWHEDHWENAIKLGPNINSENSTSTQPFVATLKNGKTYLFFASDRAKSRGKLDIWSVEIKDNGSKFGRAKNAGKNVNTKDDEITPFYNTETEELVFSSIYHKGFGGFDIFRSKGVPRKFKAPTNAGKPLNSSVNDMYYTFSNQTKKGAFVSNRSDGYALKGETCCNDIYLFGPPDTTTIDSTLLEEIPVEEDLVVRLQAVQFLPLALYFDNDKPNSNSRKISTTKTYKETFDNYLNRKPIFQNKSPNRTEIDSFFTEHVEVGFTKLQMLADSLEKYLEMGYKLQLGVKGFTSPLGDEDYNDHLALRRINSIENFLYTTNSSALKPAIDNGLLKFRQIPFGEFFSLGKVSDDYNKTSHSVYSTGASEARKVEIIWVEQTLPGDSNAYAIFEETTHNFGQIPTNKIVEKEFEFTNSGEKPLNIIDYQSDCECITAELPQQEILPGESNYIKITFNTSGRKGLQFHGIVLTTDAKIPEKKLFIRGVMERQIEE